MLKLLKFANKIRGKIENQVFENAVRAPEKTQREFLFELLKRNAETEFGRAHDFANIKSVADFRRRVGVRDYEDFRPFVNRIIAGETQILTTENPLMLTMTSGTTGEPKFVPVTRASQALNSRLMRQWLFRAERDHRGLMTKRSVGIVSRAIEGFFPSGLPFGSASGVIYKNIPRAIRSAYAVPYAVAEIEDYDERYFATARFALAHAVSFIATPNPTTLIRLAQVCRDNAENLIRAVHDGTLGLNSSKPIFAALAAGLKPDRKRARFLETIVSRAGFLRPADCWTDLKLIGCWLGGSVGLQTEKLGEFYGDAVPLRDLGYLASEGNMTVPLADDTAAGALAVSNNFYEFVPEAEIEAERPTTLLAHELETGARYGVLLTTTAGLYRYKINDIVEMTGFYRHAPLISFVRKAGEMANITGEKMHANHFLQAVETLRRKFDLSIEQFRAAPDFAAARYEIYLELQQPFSREKLRREVLPEIDAALCRANVEYEQKRKSRRLAAPCVHLMRRGWADDHLRRHVSMGKRDVQFKWQILLPHPLAEDNAFIVRTIEAEAQQISIVGV